MNNLCKCLTCGVEAWVEGPVCSCPETGAYEIDDDKVAVALGCKCDFDYEIIDTEPIYDDPRWEDET
jgi:hypothetical protein